MKYVCSHFQGRANVQSPTSRLEAQVHGGAADKGSNKCVRCSLVRILITVFFLIFGLLWSQSLTF